MRVTPAAREHGFTLLELMVALTLGGIAITSIYAVGAASTRTFHQQHQVASTQSSLRIAMGQIKRDFGRAGYMATPTAAPIASSLLCQTISAPLHAPAPTGNGALAGIARYDSDFCGNTANGCEDISRVSGTGPGVDEKANINNNFVGDAVTLMGNYDTASEYAGVRLLGGNATIAVGATWHAFQTDFMNWVDDDPTSFDQTAFDAVFPTGRLIRIRTTKGQYHFATVTGTTPPNLTSSPPTDAQIAFAPAVPASCTGDVDGAWVAPVNFIRYFPRNSPNSAAGEAAETYGQNAQLIRQEMQPGAKTTPFSINNVDLPARVVLDFLVAFRLRFVFNTVPVGATPTVDSYLPGNSDDDANDKPEMVRAVYIDLAARTPEQDRSLQWTAATCGPESVTTPPSIGRCFLVFGARPGAARVRSLHSEVFLPNIAFEGF